VLFRSEVAWTHRVAEPKRRLSIAELDALVAEFQATASDRAFEQLYGELAPYILCIVFAWLNGEQRTHELVEDACQSIWLRLASAVRNSYRIGGSGGLRPFARQVAINLCKNLNSHRRLPLIEETECGLDDGSSLLEQVPDSRPNPRDNAAVAETTRCLRKAVEALSPMHRHLIRLSYPEAFANAKGKGLRQPPTVPSREELALAMEAKFGGSFSVSRIKDMKSRAVALIRQAMLRQKRGHRRAPLSGRTGITAH
jgi:RNA polymerase sigma factor (sigma-70 family)